MTRYTYPFKHKNSVWSCAFVLGALMLLSACGSTSTGAGSTPTSTIAPTATSSGGNGYGGTTPTTTPASTATTPAGATQMVNIQTDSSGKYFFSPATLTVSVGTTVIWKDLTRAPHTVTSDDGTSFDNTNNPVMPGTTFSFTFTKAGTFPYHCNFHTYMKATITVQ